jgi:hypothetical protein
MREFHEWAGPISVTFSSGCRAAFIDMVDFESLGYVPPLRRGWRLPGDGAERA